MSTTLERYLVTFLRRLQNGDLDGNPLSYIQKIYSDTPQENMTEISLPRLQIRQQNSPPGRKLGIGSSTYVYDDIVISAIIYTSKNTPINKSAVTAFWTETRNLSPEEACGAIGDHIVEVMQKNYSTLQSDNNYKVILKNIIPYTFLGIDNEYFHNVNVFKGEIGFTFLYQYLI